MCNIYKEVYFHEYCHKCEYEKCPENDEHCSYCLDHQYNKNTHEPVNYEEKKNDEN